MNLTALKPPLSLIKRLKMYVQARGLHGLKTEARTRPVPEIVWPDPTRPDPTRPERHS